MNPGNQSNHEDTDPVTEEALRWVVRQLDAASWTENDEAALRAWRAAAPANETAFQRHASVVARMSRPEVFNADFGKRAVARPEAGRMSRRWFVIGGLAAAATIALGIFAVSRPRTWSREFQTGVAERREVELPDRTRVHLDAMTHVICIFEGDRREVQLHSGTAAFHVTPDAARLFEVLAGAQAIRVVGTFFEVKHLGNASTPENGIGVAVTEGIVDVRTKADSSRWSEPLRLSAGKAGRWMTGRSSPQFTAVAASGFAAWRTGQLLCDGARLADVVIDLQRYSGGRIELADAALGELRVSGTLLVDDLAATARLLEQALPIRVSRVAGEKILIEAAPASPSGK